MQVLHVEGSEWNTTDSSWSNSHVQVPVGLWISVFLLAIYDVLTVINDCRSTLSLILPSFRALAARFPNQMNGTQYFRWGDLRWSNNFLSSAVIKPVHKIKIAGLYRLSYSTRIQKAQRNINGHRKPHFPGHRVSLSVKKITTTTLMGIFPEKNHKFHSGLIFKNTNGFILHTYLPFASIISYILEILFVTV